MNEFWMNDAACKGMFDLFIPRRGSSKFQVEEARKICNTCPVFTECEDYALNRLSSRSAGIYAGMTDLDRRKRKRMDKFGTISVAEIREMEFNNG